MNKHSTRDSVIGQVCSKCTEWKPLAEYGPLKRGYAGLMSRCRRCMNAYHVAYRQTEKGKKVLREAYDRYYNSEKERAKRKRLCQTEKWKITNRRSVKAWCERNREKKKAAHIVSYAVTKGELPHITSCACVDCSAQAEEYHHESYEKEHWLKVDPLCRKCHLIRHGRAVM